MSTGNAVYLALSIDQMARPLGQALLHVPWLLRPLSLGTFWLEVLGPWLLFCPLGRGKLRTVAVLLFVLFHAGLGLALQLRGVPLRLRSRLAGVPATELLGARLGAPHCGPGRRADSPGAPCPAPKAHRSPERGGGDLHWIRWLVPMAVLVTVLAWNVAGLVRGKASGLQGLERFIWTARLEQSWQMFARSRSPTTAGT